MIGAFSGHFKGSLTALLDIDVQYFVLVLLLLILALTGAIVAMTQVSNGNKENGLK